LDFGVAVRRICAQTICDLQRSTANMTLRCTRGALIGALVSGLAAPLGAQRANAPEFTKQGLLIVNFTPSAGADMKLARRAAEAVRSRVGRLVNRREVEVIDGGEIAWRLERAGFNPDTTADAGAIRAIGKYFRADEYVVATVTNGRNGPTIRGELVLMRDERLRQPIPEASAVRLDSAATLFARGVASARAQLVPERRCENALREGSGSRAIAAAREGVAAYGRSTIARVCLLWALRQTSARATDILTVASEVLAMDAANVHALESAAIALDSLKRRPEAAEHWLRLAHTDTADLELSLRVSYALLDGGNAKPAEPFIVGLAAGHPDELRFTQQKWRVAYENKSWTHAIDAAELLLERDSIAKHDSAFFYRLGLAYRSAARPFKAIETLARGVTLFPKDARLYSLYSQSIKAEADTVVPRGLALFPQSADLLALSAKELRSRGKIEESLDATKRAVSIDTTMAQGQLVIAQLEIELGRPDSALVALHRALVRGEDSSLVAAFALAKGNALYKTANGTMSSSDFAAALRLIAFSDTVHSTQQARFLTGAAALGVAQTTLTDASKLQDKAASCRLTRAGAELLPLARAGLQSGDESFSEAAKQSLSYLDQLDTYAQQQLKALCAESPPTT
jgi:tetratricopeptide (TPR) repeat protein